MNSTSFPLQQHLYRRGTIRESLNLKQILDPVREAFRQYARGEAQMPAKSYLYFEEAEGDLRTMPAYLPSQNLATVKIVNAHFHNPAEHDLPSVMALILALDPQTGYPRAILDAIELTGMRTAAASALATQLLTDPDSPCLGLVGTGAQAHYQLEGQMLVRDLDRVLLHDANPTVARSFADRMGSRYPDVAFEVAPDLATLLEECQIINSLTPVTEPLLEDFSTVNLPRRLHVNAMGADAPSKQEWPDESVNLFEVVVDDWTQARHSGEISRAVEEGRLKQEDLLGSLGDLLLDPPEPVPRRILFDSTGLAIQDTAAAATVLTSGLEPDGVFSFFDG